MKKLLILFIMIIPIFLNGCTGQKTQDLSNKIDYICQYDENSDILTFGIKNKVNETLALHFDNSEQSLVILSNNINNEGYRKSFGDLVKDSIMQVPPFGTCTRKIQLSIKPGIYKVDAFYKATELKNKPKLIKNISVRPVKWKNLSNDVTYEYSLDSNNNLKYSIKNISKDEITLHFPTSNHLYAAVKDQNDSIIWTSSLNSDESFYYTYVTLQPGKEITYTSQLNGHLKNGIYVLELSSPAYELVNKAILKQDINFTNISLYNKNTVNDLKFTVNYDENKSSVIINILNNSGKNYKLHTGLFIYEILLYKNGNKLPLKQIYHSTDYNFILQSSQKISFVEPLKLNKGNYKAKVNLNIYEMLDKASKEINFEIKQ